MFAKTSMIVIGMAGAFALGLAVGPQLDVNRRVDATTVAAGADVAPVVTAAIATPRPAPPRLERVLPASSKPVQQQVRLLLNPGSDVAVAARGFDNARELMTVAYAAKNTDIPFVLLKHRVLTQRKSLAVAIRESKPELDEIAEVKRARAEAKADLARLSS